MQAVFQDPYETYNPVYRIERTLKLAVRLRASSAWRTAAGRELMAEACGA